jgi:hypothetical protein
LVLLSLDFEVRRAFLRYHSAALQVAELTLNSEIKGGFIEIP